MTSPFTEFQLPQFHFKRWWPAFVGLGLLFFIPSFVTVIDAGYVGIVSTLGTVSSQPLLPGLSFKNPLSQIIKFPTRTSEYTMSGSSSEGALAGDDSIEARASDGAVVYLDITVFYHLKPEEAPRVYQEIGLDYEAKIIRPQVRSVIREVVAYYPVNDVYTGKRDEIAQQLKTKVEEVINTRGFIVEDVLIRNVVLSDTLAISIEEKLTAQQEAQKLDFLLEREKKEAERRIIEAKGQRDAQQIINESLTDRYLQYKYIESLQNRAGTIYVPTEGGVPLFRAAN